MTRAADARDEPAEREGESLVAIQADPVGARRDVVVANGTEGAAEMRTQQPLLQQAQRADSTPSEP